VRQRLIGIILKKRRCSGIAIAGSQAHVPCLRPEIELRLRSFAIAFLPRPSPLALLDPATSDLTTMSGLSRLDSASRSDEASLFTLLLLNKLSLLSSRAADLRLFPADRKLRLSPL